MRPDRPCHPADVRSSPTARRDGAGDAPGSASSLLPLFLLTGILAASACGEPPGDETSFLPEPTPHEAQQLDIFQKGLDRTELGSVWLREAERALQRPAPLQPPYAESGRFVPPEATALGYAVRVERGQRLEVEVESDLLEDGRLLVDLFRAEPDGRARPARIRSLRSGEGRLALEPPRDGEYVLRIQPALFADGDYRLTVRRTAAFDFPVAGHDQEDVWSRFGAPREGGKREHHGVDIFAPRGTPVLASVEGVVRRADETPVGGRVVWLRDADQPRSLYYAHLDTQLVRRGQRVAIGDTLGLVGNTGNARTTPPHLHFGLYVRGQGPIDPFPFIRVLPDEPPSTTVDPALAGGWARPTTDGVRLRSGPSREAGIVSELSATTAFRVLAASGDWYRVRLPDGSQGYVAGRLAEDTGASRLAGTPPLLRAEPTVAGESPPARAPSSGSAGSAGSSPVPAQR